MARESAATYFVFVGTYTTTSGESGIRSEGIYVYQLDARTGALNHLHTVSSAPNPSFLALDPEGRHLYAVAEVGEFDGRTGGAVGAYSVDRRTGALALLGSQLSHGAAPCHLSVDATGRYVLVANYTGGSIAMLPVEDDGRLREASDFIQHAGSSVNPRRQEGPHAHSITPDPTNLFALVADLGLDQVLVYRIDLGQGRLIPNDPPAAALNPGSGPRHLAFHPNGRYVYVINELNSTLTAFSYDSARGVLEEIETLSTLPVGFTGTNWCADVHVHPNGQFVYGSNRGHDSIAVFAADPSTGRLDYVGHASTRGSTPRNFAIDPTGTFLLAANQGSDSIEVFKIDPQTGMPVPTDTSVRVPRPVCLKLLERGE